MGFPRIYSTTWFGDHVRLSSHEGCQDGGQKEEAILAVRFDPRIF